MPKLADRLLAPFVALPAMPMKLDRQGHLDNRPLTRSVLKPMGIFSLCDHHELQCDVGAASGAR